MAIKKVLLSKKVNNVVYDIFPKTSADVVVYGDSTVAAALAQFAQDLATAATDTTEAIKAESEALYNKIMGITEEDGATVAEAYDTLKEVAAWIDEHGDVAAAFTNDIAALKTAVGDENSGLIKGLADAVAAIEANDGDIAALQAAVEALETAVGDAESGLVKAMADAQAAIEALEGTTEDHETRIGALETTVGDAESGLVKGLADAQAAIEQLVERDGCKVEASETNGNIKVDGEEVVVYTHPATHGADEIVETEEKQFVSAADKAYYAAKSEVLLVSSQDEVTDELNLYMVEITE